MKLEQCVELLHRSSTRMMSALNGLQRDKAWMLFMRREGWHHLRLALKTWWKIIWWEEKG